jgi:hypothetical protein
MLSPDDTGLRRISKMRLGQARPVKIDLRFIRNEREE